MSDLSTIESHAHEGILAKPSGTPGSAAELAIVVPTFNERGNVAQLVLCLERALEGLRWEVVFVDDDSPDQTAEAVRAIARNDPRVRVVQRLGRRGLSSACVEGVLATSAPLVAVMDGDLQHDESILRDMRAALLSGSFDVAIGSRYVAGGSTGQWDGRRLAISRFATALSHLVVPAGLADPMSGFFMIRREAFMDSARNLSSIGFKILVDLFASSPRPLRFIEIPYRFRDRRSGESKLDGLVAWEYLLLLTDKLVGRWVPARFLSFAFIGGLGVFVHMAVLASLYRSAALAFVPAQAVATAVAMVFNFFVNNSLTYRASRLRGWRLLPGLASFMLACSIGAVANVGVAGYLFEHDQGWVPAALAGILLGAVWNYAATSFYTWGRRA
ncbi:MAG: glycosyltransferase family 2 protein [Burkholderiaceae bacterium]|nr:glycosyltransferase family 2 protein [Burkholderiaceae bacterium]